MKNFGLTYKKAGVNIDKADKFIDAIKGYSKDTYSKNVLFDIGHFGGFYSLSKFANLKDPVLVSSTDGVGTKLLIAKQLNSFYGLGKDLVAMNVNDLVTTGAMPLFFLDYYAVGKLDIDVGQEIIKGIADACKESGCSLIGGETAEMPDVYEGGDFDLSGFSVGIVDKDDIINGKGVKPGDVLLGLSSSGLHSNGFSLVRKVFKDKNMDSSLGESLLIPTRLYVKPLLKLFEKKRPKAIAHITGGGLLDNIPRVLPDNTEAVIDKKSWAVPAIFKHIQKEGNVASKEMFRVFNMGVGMVLVVSPDDAEDTCKILNNQEFDIFKIGVVEKSDKKRVRLI